MGVKRAVELAYAQAEGPPSPAPKKVYTLGPLIHNPRALEDLRQRGVEILDPRTPNPETLLDAVVIIRAHGVSPKTEAELRGRGAVVVDATCPRVKASQLKAASLAKQGYRLFLAGEEAHAEIAAILGYAEEGRTQGNVQGKQFLQVVGNVGEARKYAAELLAEDKVLQTGLSKTALIAQTTISAEEYRAIGMAISEYFPALEIIQTICAATVERQDSLRELLGKADAVIIAGGKASANTRRLLAIAQASGKPCAIAEAADDIPPGFFRFETVGLAAGASTPDTVIDAIERRLGTDTEKP